MPYDESIRIDTESFTIKASVHTLKGFLGEMCMGKRLRIHAPHCGGVTILLLGYLS